MTGYEPWSAVSKAEGLRLVVADDHPQVLEEIRGLLDTEFEVVDAVGSGLELVSAAQSAKPDAVVSDISMPDLDGIEAGARLLESGATRGVVLITMNNDPQLVRKASEAGIRGFVLKMDACDELIDAVWAVSRGECYTSRRVRKS